MGLSMLSRGSEDSKLKWIFTLYDVDDDGVITADELLKIVIAVNEMMGPHGNFQLYLKDLCITP